MEDKESERTLMEIYKPIFPNAHYTIVDRKMAEMIKYAANVTLTSQIIIANVIEQICVAQGINYNLLREEILRDKRIGTNTKVPGPDGKHGFGGKCFPKDLRALTYLARELGALSHLLEEMWRTNLDVREDRDWEDIPGATSGNGFD